ncbi:unnamed protein product [Heligmosomoides polygyrus]|uniref:DUF5641 domain-containing protein n=1 Tax=Heligmosomoides polygyrus TaxID=6339 RepID=A0A3P8E166_HELPZ|nr:unnamed protein product [Heligmosomoides polygyrus]
MCRAYLVLVGKAKGVSAQNQWAEWKEGKYVHTVPKSLVLMTEEKSHKTKTSVGLVCDQDTEAEVAELHHALFVNVYTTKLYATISTRQEVQYDQTPRDAIHTIDHVHHDEVPVWNQDAPLEDDHAPPVDLTGHLLLEKTILGIGSVQEKIRHTPELASKTSQYNLGEFEVITTTHLQGKQANKAIVTATPTIRTFHTSTQDLWLKNTYCDTPLETADITRWTEIAKNTTEFNANMPKFIARLGYFGPLQLGSQHHQNQKIWDCLFTCMTTRAIHLELVADNSTTQFLLAFRRFVSRRGAPSNILSDNVPNFKLGGEYSSLREFLNTSQDIWHKEYLLAIAERNQIRLAKRQSSSKQPQIGDIVLIEMDNTGRS